MSEAKTRKSYKQIFPDQKMNRKVARTMSVKKTTENRAALNRLKQRAEESILRGKLLNQPPEKMKMMPEHYLEALLLKEWPLKEAVQKVVEIYKAQTGQDIEEYLLNYVEKKMFGTKNKGKLIPKPKGESDGCHPTDRNDPETSEP